MMHTNQPKKPDAAAAMNEARSWLAKHNITHQYLPPYQIKIGSVNFWPGTGTITVDGEDQRRTEKGLTGLASLLFDDARASNTTYNLPRSASVITLRQLYK